MVWQKAGNGYYAFGSDGDLVTGWHSINGKDYYFASAPSVPTYSFDVATDTWI